MRDMPSFANFVAIKEISDSTGNTPDSSSYVEITAIETDGMDHVTYHLNNKEEVIFLLKDSKGSNTPPWTLLEEYNRLYYNGAYPFTRPFRDQNFYENILIKNGSHISSVKQPGGYTFSEMIIRRVISDRL